MNFRIDFSLSSRYGVVEQTIFRLVLARVCEVQTIRNLLPIYSDEVLANAIKNLVNYQILSANLEIRTLDLSEPVLAVMESCLNYSDTIVLPESLLDRNDLNGVYISDKKTKQQILKTILPGMKMGFLVNSLDFVLHQRGVHDE